VFERIDELMTKRLGLILLVLLMITSLAACSQKADSNEARQYADDITENMLLAYNNDNYANYIANVDSQFKTAVSEDKMKESNKMVRDKIGTYQPGSKQFKDAVRSSQNGQKFIAVRYNARFTNENGDVLVTMFFHDDQSHQVTGMFFNSPKIRQQ
jgi:hypothetical protein